jgi:hypothetical protein
VLKNWPVRRKIKTFLFNPALQLLNTRLVLSNKTEIYAELHEDFKSALRLMIA